MKHGTAIATGLLIGIGLIAGCRPTDPGAEPLPDQPVPVAVNQATRVGQDVTLRVTRIQESRCPANAICVRYGSANVNFTLEKATDTRSGELCLGECGGPLKAQDTTSVAVGGQTYRLVLTEVRPYPGTSNAQPEAVIRFLP